MTEREVLYRDEGCEVHASCLGCPLPRCIYDQRGGQKRLLRENRNQEVRRLFHRGGKGVQDLAFAFRLSRRSIYRILRRRG